MSPGEMNSVPPHLVNFASSLRSKKSPTPPSFPVSNAPAQYTRFQTRGNGNGNGNGKGQPPLHTTLLVECQGDREAKQLMTGLEGMCMLSSYNCNTLLFLDGMAWMCQSCDEEVQMVSHSKLREDYLQAATHANPYLLLDNNSTGCSKAIVVDGPVASTSDHLDRSHGTVVGNLFHEGVHLWRACINDLSLVSIGLVSAVGVGGLLKQDGSLPDFITCLRRCPLGDYKLYRCTEFSEMGQNLATNLPQTNLDGEVKFAVSFPNGIVSYMYNDVFLGSVTLGPLIGEHTVGIHLKSGARVKMIYEPSAPVFRPICSVSDSSIVNLCGNPFKRWEMEDGQAHSVGFSLPLGMAACSLFGEDVALISDRNVIRVLFIKNQQCKTVALRINDVIQGAGDLLLCGLVHGGALQPVYVTDLLNQTVLQVTPDRSDVWEAEVVVRRCFVMHGLSELHHGVQTAWVDGVLATSFGRVHATVTPLDAKRPFGPDTAGGGPWGLAVMGTWVFIADNRRHCIFGWNSALPSHEAIVVAGSPGSPGERDGWGTQCRLRGPTGIVADDTSLCLYVCDTGNNRIAKILLRFYSERCEGCLSAVELVDEETASTPVSLSVPVGLSLSVSNTTKHLIVSECYARKAYRVSIISTMTSHKRTPSISAPLERILDLLKGLKASAAGSGDDGFAIDEVIELLGKGKNIYSARMVTKGDMDEQLAGWLRAGFVETETYTASPNTQVSLEQAPTTWRRPSIKEDGGLVFAIQDGPERKKVDIKGLDSFDFNIWEWIEPCESQGGILFQVMLNIFHDYSFREKLMIDRNYMMAFCRVTQVGYQGNPYHNSIHAADVLQTVHAMLTVTGLNSKFTTLELLALFTAAAIHDYDHPGVSNQFLVATRDPLAVRYNDIAVLENYHVSQVFDAFRTHPTCDWTQFLSPIDQSVLRETIISLILSTDMKQHFSLLGKFKARFDGVNKNTEYSDEDKRTLLKALLHAADISNPTKPPVVYLEWVACVIEEFKQQGVCEAENDLPYSPFCEPEPDIRKCQRGFIDFVVRPQYVALTKAFPCLRPLTTRLESNYNAWSTMTQ